MVIHKLISTCDCGNEECPGKDGALVNITLTAANEEDIKFLTEFIEEIEGVADRVEEIKIRAEMLSLMRGALEDCYRIPRIAEGFVERILGEPAKAEEEDPFKDLSELELKEIG